MGHTCFSGGLAVLSWWFGVMLFEAFSSQNDSVILSQLALVCQVSIQARAPSRTGYNPNPSTWCS